MKDAGVQSLAFSAYRLISSPTRGGHWKRMCALSVCVHVCMCVCKSDCVIVSAHVCVCVFVCVSCVIASVSVMPSVCECKLRM
jgi:hypothetical protein